MCEEEKQAWFFTEVVTKSQLKLKISFSQDGMGKKCHGKLANRRLSTEKGEKRGVTKADLTNKEKKKPNIHNKEQEGNGFGKGGSISEDPFWLGENVKFI